MKRLNKLYIGLILCCTIIIPLDTLIIKSDFIPMLTFITPPMSYTIDLKYIITNKEEEMSLYYYF